MTTRGHNYFARLFKKEGVRRLLAAALVAAPLGLAALARAYEWYPGNGAAMSAESPDLYLPTPELLSLCGELKTVKKFGGGDYVTIQTAINGLPPTLSTNTCVVVIDSSTYSETLTVQNINTNGYRLRLMSDPSLPYQPVLAPNTPSQAVIQVISSSVTVAGFHISPSASQDFGVLAASDNAKISDVTISANFYIQTAAIMLSSWSTVENSSVTADNAHGILLQGAHNTVSHSSVSANSSGEYALYLLGASSNTVSDSFIHNGSGYGAFLNTGSNHNAVIRSTLTSGGMFYEALWLSFSANNTFSQDYIGNNSGNGAYLGTLARFTAITDSTLYSVGFNKSAIHVLEGSSNTITNSNIYSREGTAAYFYSNAFGNNVAASTITSVSNAYPALSFNTASSNTVADCYVQGSTAVTVNSSPFTMIHGSVLVSTWSGGVGINISNSTGGLFVASSTLSGGPLGTAVLIGDNNFDKVELASSTVAGGSYGFNIGANSSAFRLKVSSLTFQDLAPGATAINFGIGNFTSSFTAAAFNSPNIAINVNASQLSPGASVYMYAPSGPRAGQELTADPFGYVQWPWPAYQNVYSVFGSSASVSYGANGALGYVVLASTSDGYETRLSSATSFQGDSVLGFEGLAYNTTYYLTAGALWDRTTYYYPTDLVPVTNIETPVSVYFDEIGITTIVASAYAPTPAFSGLERGISGVAVTTGTVFDVGNSTGNYWGTRDGLDYARYMHAAGVIGGKLYVMGGFNGSLQGIMEEYDPVADSWVTATRPPMLTARKGLAAAVVGGKLYAIGGEDGGGLSAKNEAFDPVSNTWATRTPMPTARNAVAAAALGGKIYVVGGNNGTQTGLTQEYDPATDTWTTRAALGTPREGLALGAVGGKLYAAGGFNGSAGVNTNEEYDPALNTWVTRAAMPSGRNNMMAAAVGGKLFVLGGSDGAWLATNEEYDPAVNVWVTRPPMPVARWYLAGGVIDGRIYAVGGANGGNLSVNNVYETGLSRAVTGLQPNTLYNFKAKARNQAGTETGESPAVSTYTLAAVGFPEGGQPFSNISAVTLTVSWSSGSWVTGWNGPGASYKVQASTAADFSGNKISSATANLSHTFDLAANTTFFFRIQAYNSVGATDGNWLALGSTVTHIEAPTSVYIDEVGVSTIVASAYAPGAAFTGLDRGVSGVAVTSGTYDLWNSTGNYWTTKAVMPTARTNFGVSAVGSKLYLVSDYAAEFDPAANFWETKASPSGRGYPVVGAIGGKIYAVGGYNAVPLAVNEAYDPGTNTWATKSPMPTARYMSGGGVIGGRLYVVGGNVNVTEEYDPTINAWVTRAPMPTARYTLAVGVVSGKLYAIGGDNGSPLNKNEEYDPVGNAWLTKAAMPTARKYLSAAALGGKLYLIGGEPNLSTNEVYDPVADTWSSCAPMPTGRGRHAAGSLTGKIYVLGGYAGGNLDANQEYTPGVARVFGGLQPNTQYTFRAKARNQFGIETGESVSVSTYTLAYLGYIPSGQHFNGVYVTSVTVAWSSGTAAGGYNGFGARYLVQASTAADYSGTLASSSTYNSDWATLDLSANTTYHFRVQAYNSGGMTDYRWLILNSTVTNVNPPLPLPVAAVSTYTVTAAWGDNGNAPDTWYTAQAASDAGFGDIVASSQTLNAWAELGPLAIANTFYYLRVNAVNRNGAATGWVSLGSTATAVQTPTGVYFDEIGVSTITASASAHYFSGLDRQLSGVSVTTGAAFGAWTVDGDSWTVKLALPTPRYYLAAAAVGEKIYVLGGYNGSYYDTNEEYDPAANAWLTRASMPAPRREFGAASVGGRIYAIGGSNSGGDVTVTSVYDPVANTWASRAAIPTPRNQLSAVAVNGRIYALGGYKTGYKDNNEEYDPATDSWTSKAPMLTPRGDFAAAVVNGKIYTAGGYNGSAMGVVEEYDPAAGSWLTRAVLPGARYYAAGAAAGGKLYVAGGFSGSPLNQLLEYAPLENTWLPKAALPAANDSMAAAAAAGKVYVFGGSQVPSGSYEYVPGAALRFSGLTPNTQYSFKAKARNALGVETGETVAVSTYTMAAVALPAASQIFVGVYETSVAVAWSSGTAAGGYNGPGASYLVHASTAPNYSGSIISSTTYNVDGAELALAANTTYYFRVQAYNAGGMTDHSWLALGSTVTRIETPTSVYFDEVGVSTIVASAYAPGAAFSGLERQGSAVAVTTGTTFDIWGSSGGYWVGHAPMINPRWLHGGALLGGRIHTVGGGNGGGTEFDFFTTHDAYDPVLDSWAAMPSMPTRREVYAVGVIGKKLYVVGGRNSGGDLSLNEEYDPEKGQWTTRTPMPTARTRHGAAVVGGKLYVIGGSTANEAYDPGTDSWTTLAPLSTSRLNIGVAALNGKIYVVGSGNNLNEEYDPAGNTWTTRAPVPTARVWPAAGVLSGKLHVVGGWTTGAVDVNEVYDPQADTWTVRAPLPVGRRVMPAVQAGGKLYVPGGVESSSANDAYVSGAARVFGGLKPNTLYSFKAKARSQSGTLTDESATVSTYTLAAVGLPAGGQPFAEVFTSSVTLAWSSGTVAAGYNGPGAYYFIQNSTSPDFQPNVGTQTGPDALSVPVISLAPNATHYFRIRAYNSGGMTDYNWLVLGSTITAVEAPAGVYIDEVTTTTVVASAYAPSPAFTGLERGASAVSIAKDGAYDLWGSSGNYWTTKAPMPTNRWVLAAAAVGGKIYAMGGSNGSYQSKNEEYDPVSNTWVTKANMPAARNVSCAAVAGNRIYALHGDDFSGELARNDEYDPSANTWRTRADAPLTRRYAACGVINGKIYVAGGRGAVQTAALADNYEYDPSSNTWTVRAPLPAARYGMAAAVIGGKLYAAGGWNGTIYQDLNEAYDPATNTWVSKAPIPTLRRLPGAEAVGGKLYVVGGVNGGGYTAVNEEYDPGSDTWVTRAPMFTPRCEFAAAATGGKIYAMGGSDSTPIATNEEFTPGTSRKFSGLKPNFMYDFTAKARNQGGMVTGESATGYTLWTLAAGALPANGQVFGAVYASSAAVNWSSGTGTAFNGPGASFLVVASTSPDYFGANVSSFTYNVAGATLPLAANTSYYFRLQAYNSGGKTDYSWLTLGSTVTNVNPPLPLPAAAITTYSVTAAWGDNGNGPGTWYTAQAAIDSGFGNIVASSQTLNTWAELGPLAVANTYYYLRVNAVNRFGSPTGWVQLVSTATALEAPLTVYFDEVSTIAVTASAYAPAPAFTGLHLGLSGVNLTTGTGYGYWNSAGSYWSPRASMTPIARQYLAAVALGGKIYFIGGENGGNQDLNSEYDPALDAWTPRANMAFARNGLAAAAAGGKIYAIGGDWGGPSNYNEAYDPVANAWVTRTAMPEALNSVAAAALGGKIYAVGGHNGTDDVTALRAYDPAADTWETKSAMANKRSALSVAAVNGKLYAIGGADTGVAMQWNEEYDPQANNWTTRAVMPAARYHAAAAAVGGKIYVLGGNTGALPADDNQEYDPANNTWTARQRLPLARHSHAGAAVRGKIYISGGNNSGYLSQTNVYDPGVAREFPGLTPNTQYSFKAKARNAEGVETGESAVVSTYTLAAVALPLGGQIFPAVHLTSASVAWSSGTALSGFNGPGANYLVQASTAQNFSGNIISSYTAALEAAVDLWANSSWYFRVLAVNATGATDGAWLVLGSTVTEIETPTDITFVNLTDNSVDVIVQPGFTGLSEGLSSIAKALNGAYNAWFNSTSDIFSGLTPNTQYSFSAKARNLEGRETPEVTRSTWTLAVMPDTDGSDFTGVTASSFTADWAANGNPPGTTYYAQISTAPNFSAIADSSFTVNTEAGFTGVLANTTYYARVAAVNGAGIFSGYFDVGKVVTRMEAPTSVYADEVTTTSIVVSAYAPGAAFTGMERGFSAVAITSGTYDVWGSSGNYWTTRAALQSPRNYSAGAALGGKIYVLGGDNGGEMAVNEAYDPAADSWETRAPMPTARLGAAAAALGGRLYVVGGYGPSYKTVNEEYDPAANAWATKAPMPTARYSLGAAAVEGKLYAVGGADVGGMTKNEMYDPQFDTWTTKAPMPGVRYDMGAAAAGGKIYVVGGSEGSTTYEYDAAGDAWTVRAALQVPRAYLAVAASGGKIYAIGGHSGGATPFVERFDPGSGSWSTVAVMPDPRYAHAAAAAGGKIYIAGGTGVGTASAVYVPGAARLFSGLKPNTQYTFKAKARNQEGVETAESVTVTTYTLAAVALSTGATFTGVYPSSVTVAYSSGTDAGGYNGPGAYYDLHASTSPDFRGAYYLGAMNNPADVYRMVEGLASNTTYHFRIQAWNAGGMTDYSWLPLGSTVTHAMVPAAAATPFTGIGPGGELEASWDYNGNSAGTAYRLELSTKSDFSLLDRSYFPVYAAPVSMAALLANTTYYARVAAVSYSGVQTAYYVIGATVTAIDAPTAVLFPLVSTRSIDAQAYIAGGFSNLNLPQSGLAMAYNGTFGGWGVSTNFFYSGLAPNTQYSFKAKARNQYGIETAESPVFSTYTLATVSLPQEGPLFSGVWLTSVTVNWSSGTVADGFNGPGADHHVEVSRDANFDAIINGAATYGLSWSAEGLWPNTTHYFKARAVNNALVANPDWLTLGSTSTLANPVAAPFISAVYPTTVTVNWAALPPSPSSDTCEGYLVQASTAPDFSGVIKYAVTAVPGAPQLTVMNLFAETSYYFRVGTLNHGGVPNYTLAGSTWTPTENIPPTLDDNELGTDYTWYGLPTRAYNIDFHDTGGSALENFQIRATTGPGQSGAVTADWTDILTGIDSDDYTANWTLTPGAWDLLQDGTNYVTVRVFDGSGNKDEKEDAFLVFKDTTPPAIAHTYDGQVWRSTHSFTMPLEFSDPHSKVDDAEAAIWSAPGRTGSELVAWVAVFSDADSADQTYNLLMGEPAWDLLQSGTNYVSLRAWDYSVPVNTNTWTDAFVVLKDTVSPAAINTLSAASASTWTARALFDAPAEYPSGIDLFAVQYASYTVAWATSAVVNTTHVYVSTAGVTAGAGRSIGVEELAPNVTYYFRAWSRDQAGNWSGLSDGGTAVTLAQAPVPLGGQSIYVSSIAMAWVPADAAGWLVEASTANNFTGVLYSSVSAYPGEFRLAPQGLAPNTTYYIRSASLNWSGVPNYGYTYEESTFVTVPASAAVFAAVSSVSVTVEWLSNGNGPGTRYSLDVSSDGFATVLASTVTHPAGPEPYAYTFEGLAPNTTYWFLSQARGNRGDFSQFFALGSTVTAPVPPVLTGYVLWVSSADVTWDANGNGAGTLYQADLSTAANFTGALLSSVTGSAFSFSMGVLEPNTTYYLRLRAVSSATGMASPYVNAAALGLAAAPDGIGAWTVGPNNAGIYWDAAANPGGLGHSAWSGDIGLPAPLYGHAAAVSGDLLFITGGYDGASYKSAVWSAALAADGTRGAWTQVRSMPAARSAHSAVALRGRLYIIGGYDGSAARAEVWSAPISSSGALGAWTDETPLPQAVYAHAAVAGENTFCVMGGYSGGAVNNVWYTQVNTDGSLNAWAAGPALPEAVYSAAAAASDWNIYLVGGYDGVTAKTAVRRANIGAGGAPIGWTADTSLPSGLYAHAMEFAPGALFVSGGNGGTLARTAVLRAPVNPDGSIAAWYAGPALPASRQSHVMLLRGGRLLALGGYDGASAKSEAYASAVTGTEFRLQVTGAPFTHTPWAPGGWHDTGSLLPDTYYTFRPIARNFAGIEAVGPVTFSTFTYAAQPSTAALSGVFISSIQVNWLPNDNHTSVLYQARLSSDAAHTQLAFSSDTRNPYAVFEGLGDNYTYYARVRAVNTAGVATAWTALGSTTTRANPALDFTLPAMAVNFSGDAAWRAAAGTLYNIDFTDAGGAWLSSFQVRAATYAASADAAWTTVAAGVNAEAYSADWALPAGFFDLLAPGTNYISVRAWDGNSNSSTTVDAFYVLKDTAAPVITDPQTGEAAWRMDDGGAIYNVDFEDNVSGLAAIEYSASHNQGAGDAAGLSWRPIAAVSAGLKLYADNWAVDFAALPNDATNYISVRARDLAGNTETITGIDVFKILKYVAGPEIGLTAPSTAYHSALAAVAGTANDARSHAAQGVEVSVREDASGKYWDGSGFLASSQKWHAAAGTGTWTYAHGITWTQAYSYQVVARSSDSAGNYSLNYATRTFTYDDLAPVIGYTSPASAATVNAAATLSGTAYDVSGISGMALMLRRGTDDKFWDFNAATWTVSGSSVSLTPAASWSFTLPDLLRASLETGTSYFYSVYADDNSLPRKNIGFGGYPTGFDFIDDTAPAAVTDFAASTGNAPGNISLTWSAPGDDAGAGMILYGQYRVQHATDAAAGFSTAAAQTAEDFTAVPAGSARAKELTGLTPGQVYYLHMWTRDDAGNWSALSNGATAQAAPFPDRISGRVMTVSSAGITGVLVEAFDTAGMLQKSGFTVNNGSGSYALTGLAAGNYRIQATWEAEDIISSVGSENIALGASNADFILSISYELASIGGELAGYRIAGVRARALGVRPLAANVELYQRGRLVATAPVDANGRFHIGNLLPGKYTMRVPNPEGGSKELSVRVKAGEALMLSPLGELLKTNKVYVYPNPASRTATFHIETELSPVLKQLAIFDITGRLIAKLDNAAFKDCSLTACASGNTGLEAEWNIPSKVAPGVYVYSLHVKFEPTGEHKKVVKKFAIVK